MQPFMTLYRRGNSEELTDRMTGSGSSDRCAMHKGTIRRRSCAIRSQWQRTFHDLKQVEMTFVAMAIPCKRAGSRCSLALLKSLDAGRRWKIEWPEFVNVVGQTEQESLFALRGERTARCFGREFAFDRAEDSFGVNALPTLHPEQNSVVSVHPTRWLYY